MSMKRKKSTTRKKAESTRLNRLARRALMTPAEREAAAEREFEWRSRQARSGWITRRKNAGLPPGPVPPCKAVRLYLDDVRTLERMFPGCKPREALRALLRELVGG